MPADEEIMSLLRDSDNPKDRVMLSVMLQMTRSLESNTAATIAIADGFHAHVQEFQKHREEFDAHVTDELALFNQGRGMQRMLIWSVSGLGLVMTLILSMGLYIVNGHIATLVHERIINEDQEKRITTIENQPKFNRGEFEDLRNRIFKIETEIEVLEGKRK